MRQLDLFAKHKGMTHILYSGLTRGYSMTVRVSQYFTSVLTPQIHASGTSDNKTEVKRKVAGDLGNHTSTCQRVIEGIVKESRLKECSAME